MIRPGECPVCEGAGRVEADVADCRGEHTTEERECEACDGTGEQPDEDGDELDLYADVSVDAEVAWEAPL